MTLMLSELGTNAVKHGALGPRDGELNVAWNKGAEIKLNWQERLKEGVSGDIGDGFGSQILRRIVPFLLTGFVSNGGLGVGWDFWPSPQPGNVKDTQ